MSDPVRQLRVVLLVDDLDGALAYYRQTLGLRQAMALAGPDGARVTVLEAGRATLELGNAAQGRFIDAVEAGGTAGSAVRLAFEVGDTVAVTAALAERGAEVLGAPAPTPWGSLNVRLAGPAGIQSTIFQELDVETGPAGWRTDGTHDGVVVGAGLNETTTTHDPSAHAEVVAIRDTCRRTASPVPQGAVVFSSCEPCPICRTVAAMSGVAQVVWAADAALVPTQLDADPAGTARLAAAVSSVVPGLVRKGATTLDDDAVAAPFRSFLASTGR